MKREKRMMEEKGKKTKKAAGKAKKDHNRNYENGKNKKLLSIRTKLLGIILPMVLLIVVALVGTAYSITKMAITGYSRSLLRTSVENQVSEIEAWLSENLSAFGAVKKNIEQMELTDAQLQRLLDGYYGYNDNYPQGVYIADENGRLLTASESDKEESDPVDTVWFQEGMTRVNMGFTGDYSNSNGEPVISASGIIDEDSDTLRVLSADLSLQRISIIVNSYIGMDGAQAFLVNSTDRSILAHRDSSLIFSKLESSSDPLLSDIAKKLEANELDMAEVDGELTAFEEIEGTDWILVSYIPTEIVYQQVDNVRSAMIIVGIISILLLAVLIERVVYVVIKPVRELTNVIISMTEGDFTVRVNSRSRDEIGMMSRCVAKFVATMRDLIASIHGVSNKLHVQADNSNEVSGQMYDASKMQSNSMQELNETVEQLSISVNEIAENATTLAMVVADTREDSVQVTEKMQDTVTVSKQGKEDMQNVSQAMKDIKDSTLKLQEAIDKVGHASEEITNITGVIANIAEETNLLSLNASIEAARAGDAGRGFAVVATQIGQLAQTSAESVNNIDKLISEIKGLVKDTVTQAEVSVKNINSSSVLVGDALLTFDTIFNNVEGVSQLVQAMIEKVERVDEVAANVAAISQEQAASSEEILASSDTMVEQANHITGNSENVANGAKELTGSAEELAHQVEIFRIE